MRFVALLSILSIVAGCSSRAAPANSWVPIAEVPAELQEVAHKTLPGVNFESARKINVRGEERFEIRGRGPNGKIREVEITPAGDVREIE
jgi:hypothetical protein